MMPHDLLSASLLSHWSDHLRDLDIELQQLAPAIANHLWQSTAFAAAAGLLTLALRRNFARTRHWIWMAASLKFLLPFALVSGLTAHFAAQKVVAPTTPVIYSTVDDFSEPFTTPAAPIGSLAAPTAPVTESPIVRPEIRLGDWLALAAVVVWAMGFFAVLTVWTVRWMRVARTVRFAETLESGREIELLRGLEQKDGLRKPIRAVLAASAMEPGIFGLGLWKARPVLVWPAGISERLDDAHLEAILAHEVCHVRRRDNLLAALHMLVEAVFWFHPLVWWMGTRLVAEREHACDEEVLQLCARPQVYAESILRVCEFCVESPLECVAGITGADLKRRVVEIMRARTRLRLTWPKRALLGAAVLCAIAVPVVMGQAKAARRLMMAAIKVAPKPLQTAAHAMIAEEQATSTEEVAQTPVGAMPEGLAAMFVADSNSSAVAAGSGPRFEAAHVERNKLLPIPPQSGPTHEGDRYVIYALSMQALISYAYNVPENEILGGPPWLESDRYDIEAKTPTTTSDADVQMMMKALLGERFHLVVHKGTVPLPVRALYLEKGASSLKPSDGKAEPGCSGQPPAPGGPLTITLDCHNQTIEYLAQMLQNQGGWQDKRPVVDKTGLKGGFDFKLSLALGSAGGTGLQAETSLIDALQSGLGLTVASETEQHEALIVDSYSEDPAPDPPDTATIMPASPLPVLDISVIKPFDPNSQRRYMMGNGRIDMNGVPLSVLIRSAWRLNYPNYFNMADAPAWLDKDLWYISAKMSSDSPGSNGNNPSQVDPQQFLLMVRALLAERFHLQAHMEEREGDAYDLVAVNPKLTPIDPSLPPLDPRLRETTLSAPPPGSVDTRTKNPALDQLIYMQNETIQHLADVMKVLAGSDVHIKVFNKTGLTGRYNITLRYSSAYKMPGNGAGPAASAANGPPAEISASDPGEFVPLSEALKNDLGLKLVKVRAPVPMLVIDHIDETPTAN